MKINQGNFITDKNIKIAWIDEYFSLIKNSPNFSDLNINLNKSVIVTGASVTGKTTLFRCMVSYFNLEPIPVHTTRSLRGDEVAGVDMFFLSEDEFKVNFSKGFYIQESLEQSYFSGAYYGCPNSWINSVKNKKMNCFVCPTVFIANKVKKILQDKIFWIHMIADKNVRKDRLMRRNPEMTNEDFEIRIKRGDAVVDVSNSDLVIDSSYLSASDIFFKAIKSL